MAWAESLQKHLRNRAILKVFLPVLETRKQEWREEKKKTMQNMQKELVDIAMHPTRVQDWYMDWETRQEVRNFFGSQQSPK